MNRLLHGWSGAYVVLDLRSYPAVSLNRHPNRPSIFPPSKQITASKPPARERGNAVASWSFNYNGACSVYIPPPRFRLITHPLPPNIPHPPPTPPFQSDQTSQTRSAQPSLAPLQPTHSLLPPPPPPPPSPPPSLPPPPPPHHHHHHHHHHHLITTIIITIITTITTTTKPPPLPSPHLISRNAHPPKPPLLSSVPRYLCIPPLFFPSAAPAAPAAVCEKNQKKGKKKKEKAFGFLGFLGSLMRDLGTGCWVFFRGFFFFPVPRWLK